MDLEIVRDVLAWCAVINLGILAAWFLMFALARDAVYRMHKQWFKLPADRFDAIHYAGMAIFKIGILLFCLVPYLALRIVL